MGKLSRRIIKTLDFQNESCILIIELIIKEKNMSETVFISANNGGIEVGIGVSNKVGFAKTAKMLAYILDTKKIYCEVMFTSSMDLQVNMVSQTMVMQENCLMMQ